MRCTTDRIPSTYEAGKNSGIPFGIIVKPYGDLPEGSKVRKNIYLSGYSKIYKSFVYFGKIKPADVILILF